MFHALPLLGALHGAAALLYGLSFAERDYASIQYNSSTTYFTLLVVFLLDSSNPHRHVASDRAFGKVVNYGPKTAGQVQLRHLELRSAMGALPAHHL
jgi:hypothetical protein